MAPKVSRKARDKARRNTRGRFEQWAKNPSCEANTISAVRNVRMADVARADGIEPSFGQSPFAIIRGDQFERNLFRRDAERLIPELIRKEVLASGLSRLLDLRLKMNGGTRLKSLDDALSETEGLLRDIATTAKRKRTGLPVLIAAATVKIPRGVMLPEAVLIIDALAVRLDEDLPRLIVGEIKTYPDRGGHTDPAELAVARAQAGLYVHALDVVCEQLGIADRLVIDRNGFLVLSRPGSNFPSVRAGEDLRYQAERARRGFDLLEKAAQDLPKDLWAVPDTDPPKPLIQAIQGAETAYGEGCLSFCDRAPLCFKAALDDGDGIVLGDDAARYLNGVRLDRVMALLGGSPPTDDAEVDLLARINESDRMAAL